MLLSVSSNEVMYYLGPVLSLFGAGGGAWLALKVGLNGAKERIWKIERTTDRIEEHQRIAETKLSVLESRHDALTEAVKDHPPNCPWQSRAADDK